MMIPRALVVEDCDPHRHIAETILTQTGFQVIGVRSLYQCIERATTLLDPSQPQIPTLILLDLMLPHERCPILEGTAGAAWLIEQMELSYLHPAHIVAITGDLTAEREREAQAAGCELILTKSLTMEKAMRLRKLVSQPPVLPVAADARLSAVEADKQRTVRRMLRRRAAELIHFIRSDPVYAAAVVVDDTSPIWSGAEVRVLLSHPTKLLHNEPWRGWIHRHGGVQQICQWIRVRVQQKWDNEKNRKYRDAVEAYMAHGDQGYHHAGQFGRSSASFFRDLRDALEELAADLNLWD